MGPSHNIISKLKMLNQKMDEGTISIFKNSYMYTQTYKNVNHVPMLNMFKNVVIIIILK